jgi:hypothetical protein
MHGLVEEAVGIFILSVLGKLGLGSFKFVTIMQPNVGVPFDSVSVFECTNFRGSGCGKLSVKKRCSTAQAVVVVVHGGSYAKKKSSNTE